MSRRKAEASCSAPTRAGGRQMKGPPLTELNRLSGGYALELAPKYPARFKMGMSCLEWK